MKTLEELFGINTDVDVMDKTDIDDGTKNASKLILWNDDVNSFDAVIIALVKICKHTVEQAEQCAHIVHFNGKCSIKEGPKSSLEPLKEALENRNLTVEIQ